MRYLDWTRRIGGIVHTGWLWFSYSRRLRGLSLCISLLAISLQFLLLLIRNLSEAIFDQHKRRSVCLSLLSSRINLFIAGILIIFFMKNNLIFTLRISLWAVTADLQVLLNFYLLLGHVVLINGLTSRRHVWKIFHRLHHIAMSSCLRLQLFHRAVTDLFQHNWLVWL